MQQVLFHIPLKPFNWLPGWWPEQAPLYGFAVMLILALVLCTWLAGSLAQREGIPRRALEDLAIWICVAGVIGARIVFMIQYHVPWQDFYRLWEGGLVFYGSVIGGVVGYFLGKRLILSRYPWITTWHMADSLAPALALGLCLGRIGCLLNGCCYGNVACGDVPKITFPLSAPPRYSLVHQGLETAAGFTIAFPSRVPVVGAVESGSQADIAGLRAGDAIIGVNGNPTTIGDGDKTIASFNQLNKQFSEHWPRGQNDVQLTVERNGRKINLPTIAPRTLGLHPTQVYESISMILLVLVLLAYYGLRRRPGEVAIIFILGYAVHRFLNEALRNDTDPVAFGLTLSQNGSILFFLLGLVLAWYLWIARKPVSDSTEGSNRPGPANHLAKRDADMIQGHIA
jgi:phosphatidylglycerol---prolipoprotein diacylglyceryl transferase